MSNIIVECRNKEASNAFKNGDWTTTLPENILIEQGDQIIIKDSFIDTQQSSTSKILIKEDLTISMNYGFYQPNNVTDWYLDYATNAPILTNQNMKQRVLTYEVDNLQADDVIVQEYWLVSDAKEGSEEVVITFLTEDYNSDPQNITLRIPALLPNTVYKVTQLRNLLIKEPFGIQTDKELKGLGLAVKTFNTTGVAGLKVMLPYLQQLDVTLPAGNYDPDELVEYLNTEVSRNNATVSTFITKSNILLQQARQIQSLYHTGAANTRTFGMVQVVGTDEPFKIKTMHNYPTIAADENDMFFGASQFELSFSQATKRYSIDYAHTPLYGSNGVPVVGYILDDNADQTFTWVTQTGGVWFDRLFATNSSGVPVDFWNATLGFDTEKIITKFDYVSFTGAGPANYLMPQTDNFVNGKGITGGLVTADAAVDKTIPTPPGQPYSTVGYAVPSVDEVEAGFYSSISTTTTDGIIGDTAIDSIDTFGYYLIEVNSQFRNDFLTPDNNFRSISQIVSRYYEINSYTSGEGGQVIYQHSGDPMLLQSFRCRVLQSDKTVPDFIGDDNTIHIQVIKQKKEEAI